MTTELLPIVDCHTCGGDLTTAPEDKDKCPQSKRACGHHCNHSWSHDVCHWCNKRWYGGIIPWPTQEKEN